jgi:RIO kinase 1
MELVTDAEGNPAPRLGEVQLTDTQAREYHLFLMRQIVRMLCTGLIHGDLSEFNVLVDAEGPVIIDLPQAVNAAGNNSAFAMLERDVGNITNCLGRAAPELLETRYAQEIWALFAQGDLQPDSTLTGRFADPDVAPDVTIVMHAIDDAREEALQRQLRAADAASGGDVAGGTAQLRVRHRH